MSSLLLLVVCYGIPAALIVVGLIWLLLGSWITSWVWG